MNEPSELNILVVDDEPVILDLLKRSLKVAGCKVSTASDGQLGLEAIAKNRVDILILDVDMPGLDGLSTAIEALKIEPDLPILIITRYTDQDIIDGVKELDVVDTIMKPFKNTDIINAINKALVRRAQRARNLSQTK